MTIPGAADVYPEQVTGAPYLDIRVNREAAARYGISVGAIQDVIETAVGETNLTLTIEGRQRFPVRVRYAPQYRASPEALGSVLVTGPAGAQVPLGQVAEIRPVSGPAMIASENGLLVVTVLLNVRGRDVGSFVDEARRVVADTVPLPKGSYIEWSGQYENEARARAAAADRRPRRAAGDLHAALHDLRLVPGGGPCAARGAVRAVGRPLSPLCPRLQLLGGGLGGVHRALRHGRPDRRRDGDLPRRGGAAKARGAGRATDATGAAGGGQGGRAPAPPARR